MTTRDSGAPNAARPFYARLRLALIGSYALIAASLCGAAVVYVLQDRLDRLDEATRASSTLARALDEHVRRTFDAVDVLLADVAYGIAEDGGIPRVSEERVHRMLRAKQALMPQINGMFVYGPDSILYAGSSRVPAPRLNGRETEYVKAHRLDPAPSLLFVGLPQPSPVTGLPTIPTTRRIPGPRGGFGGFGGVVGASLDPSRLEAFYRDLGLAPGQSLVLFRADGLLLIRFPHSPHLPPGFDLKSTPLMTEGLSRAPIGSVHFKSTLDGIEHIIAYRSIPDLHLAVAVSNDVNEILARWRRDTARIAGGVAGALAALLALLWVALREIRGRAADEARLNESERRFARTMQASPESITVAGLDDGIFVEVNPACEALYGFARAEMLGHTGLELGIWTNPDDRQRFVDEVRRDGVVNGRELRLRCKDGKVRDVLASAALVEFEGEPLLMVQSIDISDRKRAEARAQYLATRDPLTDLPNRTLLSERLSHSIVTARRLGTSIAVMFIDVDRFKAVNDSLGHHVGDKLLIAVAARIRRAIREEDTLARFGGDEFVVVVEGLRSREAAEGVARKIPAALAAPFDVDGHTLNVSASIGVTCWPGDGDDAHDLIRAADIAMYRAKERRRGDVQLFSADMNALTLHRQKLESRLWQAIERGTLEIAYQPKVDIAAGRVSGAEALLRWNDEELGEVPPSRFIPLAEETGLIVSLGRLVLRRVAAQLRVWQDRGLTLSVAVNLSARQFNDQLVAEVASTLKGANVDPHRLELEVTESIFLGGLEESERIVRQLTDLGLLFTIDDFGTGYSSLGYLKRFPFHSIKIDRSFIHGIVADAQDAAIVRAVVALAHSFGVKIVAEGVETRDQLERLRELGCDEYQGFLFSAAVPPAELEKLATR
ncbi:MAG TPA: EAL domain-containing protein [Burkholderiales bacterium]|nr:EAL domain-containing protein [Burkholderiales bacterium]